MFPPRLYLIPVCLALFLARPLSAAILINENWESYANGAVPTSPWSVWTGSPSGSLGSITVTDAKSYGTGTKSAYLNGVGSSTGSVALNQSFAATTSALSISFDFYLGASPGVIPQFSLLNSSGTAGLILQLRNYAGTNIMNRTGDFQTGNNLSTVALSSWYHIDITTSAASVSGNTYSITITQNGGSPVTYSNLNFYNQIANFSKIEFGWGSTNGREMYVDNIVVATVPEPSVALLLGLGAFALIMRLPRRSLNR
ncbi:MAG: PEP-CTERM sorting domain-containing protein [Verrucomicrobia bacterium]|nr:PEP-CTERM sorting domain-containing protein [Verrucomicrobiota bacterium]